jgi:hypothetical protein
MAVVRVNPRLEAELTGHTLGTDTQVRGQMERVLGRQAEDIAVAARLLARREWYRHGDYLRSIRGEVGLNDHGELVGRVTASDWKSHWAEFGTSSIRAHHILAHAAQAVGMVVLGTGLAHSAFTGGRALAGRSSRRGLPSATRRALAGR